MENKKIPIPVKLPLEAFNFGDDEHYDNGIINKYYRYFDELWYTDGKEGFDLRHLDCFDENNPSYYIYECLVDELVYADDNTDASCTDYYTQQTWASIFFSIYTTLELYDPEDFRDPRLVLPSRIKKLSETYNSTPIKVEMILSCALFLFQIDPYFHPDDMFQKYINILQEKCGNTEFYKKLVNSYNARFSDSTNQSSVKRTRQPHSLFKIDETERMRNKFLYYLKDHNIELLEKDIEYTPKDRLKIYHLLMDFVKNHEDEKETTSAASYIRFLTNTCSLLKANVKGKNDANFETEIRNLIYEKK